MRKTIVGCSEAALPVDTFELSIFQPDLVQSVTGASFATKKEFTLFSIQLEMFFDSEKLVVAHHRGHSIPESIFETFRCLV